MATPRTDPPPGHHMYQHTEYNDAVQPELASNFNQSNVNQPAQPQWANNFNQSNFSQLAQPQWANNFNQSNANQPAQPQWANNFNQPSQLQSVTSNPPGNVPYVPGNNVVQTTQPMVFMAPVPCQIPDYQVYSIFTMIFCCFPIGLAACIFSRKTKEANLNYDAELAQQCSRKALLFNNVALAVGIIVAIAYISDAEDFIMEEIGEVVAEVLQRGNEVGDS
ncbi:hypothetical protein NDU88_010749 [Pleurodeles waltl]|uniref:Uncharacterized protein n=1 Tax=Pleurodeles waltl TaxID=8319 RepID=A0AAV7PWG7_PLEWA|nr:hypothetical protein NDU88_010749 [Pleurodeles waltl]